MVRYHWGATPLRANRKGAQGTASLVACGSSRKALRNELILKIPIENRISGVCLVSPWQQLTHPLLANIELLAR